MANRIWRAEHTSYNGIEWRVDLFDDLAVSINTRTTVTASDGVSIKMEGRNKLYDWIHPSTCEFSLAIQNDDHESVIEAFADSDQGRYFVQVTKSSNLVFTGIIINDTVTIEDGPYPYFYTIRAIDGLATLKDVDYSNSGVAYTGRQTFAQIILRALTYLPTATFYDSGGPGVPFFRTAVNWYESQMADTTKDPLEWTRIDHRILDKRELSSDEPEFYSCWDVLELCCIRWGARLYYQDNRYYFVQPHLYASTSTIKFFQYYPYADGGASVGSTSVDTAVLIKDATNTSSTKYARAGGTFSFYNAVKRVILKFYHSSINYLRDANWNELDNTLYTVGDIDTTSENVRMIFSGRFWVQVTDSLLSLGDRLDYPVRVVFQMRVKVGTYHLKRTSVGTFTNPRYDDPNGVWLNSAEYFEAVSDVFEYSGEFKSVGIEIQTAALPDIGVESWVVDQVAIRWMVDDGGVAVVYTPDTITWRLDKPVGYLFDDENPFKTKFYTEHIATNVNSNNKVDEYEIAFADEPNGWSVDRIDVWTGAAWVDSENWQIDKVGTQRSFNDLFVFTLASLQRLPLRTREGGNINAYILPNSRINYQGNNFIPAKINIHSNPDEDSGEIVQIRQDLTGITITNVFTEISRPLITEDNMNLIAGAADYSLYNGISHGVLAGNVSSGVTTTIAVNALDYGFLKDGDVIIMLNKFNGNFEKLTMTADAAAGATSLSVSGTLTNDYPAGSAIFLDPQYLGQQTPRENSTEYGIWDNQTAAFIVAATPTSGDAITLPDATTLSVSEINRRMDVYRNGVRQRYRGVYTAPFTDYGYRIINSTGRVYVYPDLVAEELEIKNVKI